ncbi:MAG TPA: cytochrome c [Lacunisphaera sp.]|nr:cytochrome c [Lacunisphaera sp.]
MRSLACATAVLLLAACSKAEPPAAAAASPAAAAEKPAAPAPKSAPAPTPAAPPARAGAAAPTKVDMDALLKQGAKVYADTCATCHMADGNGVPFMQPGINKSAWISNPDPQYLLSLILRGAEVVGAAADAYDNKMAPQDALSDEQVAAVATYVRHRFAAEPITKPVTPAEVAVARARPGLPK